MMSHILRSNMNYAEITFDIQTMQYTTEWDYQISYDLKTPTFT